jgi:Mg2+ and Co2+ transporter CorA
LIDPTAFIAFLEPSGWFLTLGKTETDHIKQEIQDLLQHSSQSLRSLIELTETLREVPVADFDMKSFSKIANACLAFFTSPEAAQMARTHCTDIERDTNRITFKMAGFLRAEGGEWKGLNQAFNALLLKADWTFLDQYANELERIGDELKAIEGILQRGDRNAAWARYNALRTSLMTLKWDLANEIASMQQAETHIRSLLT